MIRVFVSSVSVGLEPTRRQIIEDLGKANYDVAAMERFGAQPSVPLDACLKEVRRSDAVVLLIGPRYGSTLPQGISYTHAEFREAQGAGIPVLAFRLPADATASTDDSQQLASFLSEVGANATYDSMLPGESLDRLSAKVLAAIARARDRGELGKRFSPFQKFDRFFSAQLGDSSSLFNHEGPFLGRAAQLERLATFISSNEPILVIKAPGGSGKSRLLLEAARAASETPGSPQVYFVDSAAAWSSEDINLLPVTPLVLVFDDAHRRPDLDRVIAACQQHNEGVRFLMSCRPSAIGIVAPLVAPLVSGSGLPELDLPVLGRSDSESLAKHFLGEPLHHLAARLASIADSNPLVVRVGAQCIEEKLVLPEMLERTPEAFRRVVLDRLLDDPLLKADDAVATRRVLEVIAAIGPVATESDDLLTNLSSIAQLPEPEVRRILATLERTKFLWRRGRLVRVSPDVLADHLLYIAAVDDLGKPTRFVDQMVAAFRPSLENILANAAELDWRSEATDGPNSVLRKVWTDLFEILPTASNRQRAELVGQLKRAAIFAPAEVLRICEWLAQNPDAPEDELLAQWGIEDSPNSLIDALTDVISLIATHPDFTKRCASVLWDFGVRDVRPLNPYPSHPRRRLADLVKYEPRTGWETPDGAQVKAIEFLVDRLRSRSRSGSATWAVSALAGALHRTGEANESNRRVFTLREFSLASFSQQLSERRNEVLQCLVDVALGERLDEAATALAELSTCLRAPRGPFGRGLDAAEIGVWQSEAEHVISLLHRITEVAPSDVIRFLARRELRAASKAHWPQIAPVLDKAVQDSRPVPSEPLYDLLIGVPWEEQLEGWADEDERVERLCAEAAAAFWKAQGSPEGVVKALMAAKASISGAGRETDSQTGRLVRALVLASLADSRDLVQQLAAHEEMWPLLRSALLAVHEKERALAEALVVELSRSEHAVLRAFAIDSVQWMVESAADLSTLIELTRSLSRDPAPVVRGAVARVLRRLAKHAQADALKTLVAIDWSGLGWLGDQVLGALDPTRGLEPNKLTDEDIDVLVSKIGQLRTLDDDRNHEIFEFISFASTRRPEQVVEMLIKRVASVDEHKEDKGADRWLPIPYSGRGLSLPGAQNPSRQLALVNRVRDATLSASSSAQFWLPALFRVVDPKFVAGRSSLREWIASADAEKIVCAATLLKGFTHSLVFTDHEFISELIIAANACGADTLRDVKGELFSLAISGVTTGIPGEPAPRHLEDKRQAQQLADTYAAREPVAEFYRTLLAQAESNIRRDVALFDDGDDE